MNAIPAASPALSPSLPNRLTGRWQRLSPSALSVGIGVFAAALIAVVWVAVVAVLQWKWQDELDAETRQNHNLASALTEQTVRVIATIDQATLRVRDAVAAGDSAPDLIRLANETGLAPAILAQLALVDAQGRFVGSNLDPTGEKSNHVDLSAREHVRVHLDPAALPPGSTQPSVDGLYIGKPVLGKVSNKWTIQLSRKISAPDGRVLGVVVASLDPAYFEQVYQRVSRGRTGGVALVGWDMNIRARVVGGQANGMGSSLPANSAAAAHAGRPEGEYRTISALDGVERLYAYRQVANYPLSLQVSSGVDEATTQWRSTRDIMLLLAASLTAVVAGAAAILLAGLRRLERTNQALRASEAQANAANQAKTEFLAAISHELRTPLTSIRGFAELMETRLEQPRFRESAGLIRKGAEHLNNLLSEILDLAKVEAGGMELNVEPVDLRSLVQGTADFFALAASEKQLELAVHVADDVPGSVACDGLRIKQILNNLMSNALKFTPSGRIGLSAETAGRDLLIHVDDTGPGVAPEMQDAIFEKFRQGNARVSYEHGGTGLGLALSRALAQLMGGRLTLDSTVGRGSRFTLALPLAASA